MTCRFSGADDAGPPRQVLAPATRRARRPLAAGSWRAQKSLIRSSPATLARTAVPCLSRLCDKSAHEVERRDGRAPPDRLAVAGEVELRAALAVGPDRVQVDEPDRLLLACRRPGPATPGDRDRDVGAERARARRAPSRPRSRPRPRRARASISAGTPSSRCLDLVRVRDDRRREHVARARARRSAAPATRPPVHDSAVASVSPRSRSRSRTSSAVDRLVAREEVALVRRDERALELVGARLGARLDEQVDVDLEVARADRHVHAVAVAARAASAWATADSRRRRRSAARGARRARAAREQRAQRLGLEHARPELLQLARRAGQRDRDARAGLEHDRRRRARRARPTIAPSGSVACLRTPCGEVRVRPVAAASATRRESSSISASSSSSTCEADAGGAREQLDRAVVVGRPEAARDDEQVVARAPRASAARDRRGRRRRP